jgi:hypothetical protein
VISYRILASRWLILQETALVRAAGGNRGCCAAFLMRTCINAADVSLTIVIAFRGGLDVGEVAGT